MGYKQKKSEVKKIELDDDYWVKMKTGLSYERYQSIQEGLNKKLDEMKDDGQEITTRKKNRVWGVVALVHCIEEWNIDDENDDVLDVTYDNIKILDMADYNLLSEIIVKKINKMKELKKGKGVPSDT